MGDKTLFVRPGHKCVCTMNQCLARKYTDIPLPDAVGKQFWLSVVFHLCQPSSIKWQCPSSLMSHFITVRSNTCSTTLVQRTLYGWCDLLEHLSTWSTTCCYRLIKHKHVSLVHNTECLRLITHKYNNCDQERPKVKQKKEDHYSKFKQILRTIHAT